jgi:hypothetical protein
MLDLGWRKQETRESIWLDDPALVGVSEAAIQEWIEDGEARHLLPFEKNGKAQIIEFRTLTADEVEAVKGVYREAGDQEEKNARACILAFRIGVTLPGLKATWNIGDGIDRPVTVKERGIRMLAEPFVTHLSLRYDGIVKFYGRKIINGSLLQDAEKKASSPPSTPMPSSAPQTSAGTTEPPPSEAGA